MPNVERTCDDLRSPSTPVSALCRDLAIMGALNPPPMQRLFEDISCPKHLDGGGWLANMSLARSVETSENLRISGHCIAIRRHFTVFGYASEFHAHCIAIVAF